VDRVEHHVADGRRVRVGGVLAQLRRRPEGRVEVGGQDAGQGGQVEGRVVGAQGRGHGQAPGARG
ncbi:MAG: hypothetical protein ACK559_29075, partial [bacterium]